MKKTCLRCLTASAVLCLCAVAYANESEGGFAEHKANMIKRLNDEKSVFDQMISCVNSAQKHEDMKKCHEQRQTAMQKLREQDREMHKKHLQDELKRLDEEGKKQPGK